MNVSIIEDHFVIDIGNIPPYSIPINACNTPETILNWARHLAEKTWMTNEAMGEFLEKACKTANITRFRS